MNDPFDRFARTSRMLLGLTALLLLGGVAEVAHLQLAPSEQLIAVMGSRTTNRTELHGRGSITDRRGRLIAFTEIGHRVYVDASLVWREGLSVHDDPFVALAEAINERTALDIDETYTRLMKTLRVDRTSGELVSSSRYVVLINDASDAVVDALQSSPIRGVVAQQRPLRRYPFGDVATQLLGKVGPGTLRRQQGRTGIELVHQRTLLPKHGSLEYVRDRSGKPLYAPDGAYERGLDGADIHLTIDLELQRKAEALLQAAVDAHQAVGGWMIVIDPSNGEILAAADVFRNDVARERGGWPESWLDPLRDKALSMARNRIWTDPFEPGSTFKPFFWSWATMNGHATPDEILPTPGGGYGTSGVVFRDGRRSRRIKDSYGQPDADWSTALIKSLNTAMAMVAERVEPAEMQAMIEAFGFRSRTGIAMPGEATGLMTSPERWDQLYTHLSVSFGQEIAVTPVQLARAFCVFARDDGTLPLLRLTRVGEAASFATPSLPVLSRDAVQATRRTLERVMKQGGTGRLAASEQYSIFGKSGTPQMPNVQRKQGESGYFDDRYMPNFLAASPVAHPRIVVACGLQDPLKGAGANADRNNHGYGGGYSAGRVVRDMIDFSLEYLGVPSDLAHAE
jgi:cell division protein FtsI (penicillin-binding protein 3)